MAFVPLFAVAQSDLMDLLSEDSTEVSTVYTTSTFKTTRVIHGQSTRIPARGELLFVIQHRFGKVNDGFVQLFGLDQSTIRFGFEFTPVNRLAIGFGRSSFGKTFDGSLKYVAIRQQKGKRNIPFSMVLNSSMFIDGQPWQHPENVNRFTHRMSYAHMLLISRKFNSNFSFQLSPAMLHYNIVPTSDDHHDIYALGMGGRYKITPRFAITGEYFWVPDKQSMADMYNSFSLGVDIETGGHVFQLHITNSQAMFERGFIAETSGNWMKGDIHFGFNISRSFQLYR